MNSKNCISYWYPKLLESGVQTPKTVFVHTDLEFMKWTCPDPKHPIRPADAKAMALFIEQLQWAGEEVGGAPFFLRSGHTSAKHGWKDTCHVKSMNDIQKHVFEISIFCDCADIIGLPQNVWAVRELLKTEPAFIAFQGMPITKERRYFFNKGKVVGWHPYWPPNAIGEDHQSADSFCHTNDPDWRRKLEDMNTSDHIERSVLTRLTENVAAKFDGAWSIDWLFTDRGYVAIDMALASQSFIWEDYPSAPKREDLIG